MLKEPGAGRVKTRLGEGIGMVEAAWWFRHQTTRLARRLVDPRWETLLAISPDTALGTRAYARHLPRVPQGRGHLGKRMIRVVRALPPGPALVIGGDIPGVTRAHVAAAFRALGSADAVFGPATDGGYWLIGFRRTAALPAGALEEVRWSTEHALCDSINSLSGMRIARVRTLHDVDDAADLARLRGSA